MPKERSSKSILDKDEEENLVAFCSHLWKAQQFIHFKKIEVLLTEYFQDHPREKPLKAQGLSHRWFLGLLKRHNHSHISCKNMKNMKSFYVLNDDEISDIKQDFYDIISGVKTVENLPTISRKRPRSGVESTTVNNKRRKPNRAVPDDQVSYKMNSPRKGRMDSSAVPVRDIIYKVGEPLEVLDNNIWWKARIVEIRRNNDIKIHFYGWSRSFDTWQQKDSAKLRGPTDIVLVPAQQNKDDKNAEVTNNRQNSINHPSTNHPSSTNQPTKTNSAPIVSHLNHPTSSTTDSLTAVPGFQSMKLKLAISDFNMGKSSINKVCKDYDLRIDLLKQSLPSNCSLIKEKEDFLKLEDFEKVDKWITDRSNEGWRITNECLRAYFIHLLNTTSNYNVYFDENSLKNQPTLTWINEFRCKHSYGLETNDPLQAMKSSLFTSFKWIGAGRLAKCPKTKSLKPAHVIYINQVEINLKEKTKLEYLNQVNIADKEDTINVFTCIEAGGQSFEPMLIVPGNFNFPDTEKGRITNWHQKSVAPTHLSDYIQKKILPKCSNEKKLIIFRTNLTQLNYETHMLGYDKNLQIFRFLSLCFDL